MSKHKLASKVLSVVVVIVLAPVPRKPLLWVIVIVILFLESLVIDEETESG